MQHAKAMVRPARQGPHYACSRLAPSLVLCRSEQLPLVEQRLAAVGAQLGPAAAASEALQALRQRVEEECVPALVKPPLAELEGERDAALASMAAQLSERGLPALVSLGTARCDALLPLPLDTPAGDIRCHAQHTSLTHASQLPSAAARPAGRRRRALRRAAGGGGGAAAA